MPMVEDLTAFFNVDEHATQAVLDNVAVAGIFDNGYAAVLGGVATLVPQFVLAAADAARAKQGSTLRMVGGNAYRVSNIEPDGTGVTTLILERAT